MLWGSCCAVGQLLCCGAAAVQLLSGGVVELLAEE